MNIELGKNLKVGDVVEFPHYLGCGRIVGFKFEDEFRRRAMVEFGNQCDYEDIHYTQHYHVVPEERFGTPCDFGNFWADEYFCEDDDEYGIHWMYKFFNSPPTAGQKAWTLILHLMSNILNDTHPDKEDTDTDYDHRRIADNLGISLSEWHGWNRRTPSMSLRDFVEMAHKSGHEIIVKRK